MAKRADPGAMRTKIRVMKLIDGRNGNGYRTATFVNVLEDGGVIPCKWVHEHGKEVFAARQLGLSDPATLTLRYHPDIVPTCEIYKGDDPAPYEIISINDVEDRHAWLEIKVSRKVATK